MKAKTPLPLYIYSFKYDRHYSDLCKLESRQLFGSEEKERVLFSNVKIDPSISPFLRARFEIIATSESYNDLLKKIEEEHIHVDGFKAEYLALEGEPVEYPERLKKLKDIGDRIHGEPDFKTPHIIYSICSFEGKWYFGRLIKHQKDWHKHRKKPCSFSNAIGINIAKTLVSIASKGNNKSYLLDACCGVGTVLLEACIAGNPIDGCDINWKACKHSRENLAFFNYEHEVFRSDVKDLEKSYDAVIVDLPYNMYAKSTDDIAHSIIESAARLASRVVIVSVADIRDMIKSTGLMVIDSCNIEKRGQTSFVRRIWVCETKKP